MTSPMIIEERPMNITAIDVFSRLTMDRIIFLGSAIDAEVASTVIAQLLYLDSLNHDDIIIYINSPGGEIISGLAIYDTMKFVKSKVRTIAVGMAASMASILLAGGKERLALPNSRILIHQPRGFTGGTAKDILIDAKEIEKDYKILAGILSEHTGQPFDKVHKDMDRDYWMTAEEALEYHLIDKIIWPGIG